MTGMEKDTQNFSCEKRLTRLDLSLPLKKGEKEVLWYKYCEGRL